MIVVLVNPLWWIVGATTVDNLINYLFSRLGKRTCPIIAIHQVFDTGFDSPWREWYEITFKDGSKVELIEKPK